MTASFPSVRVAILMGSDSDYPVMAEAAATLDQFQIGYELRVLSAHRSPAQLHDYVHQAGQRGVQIFIVGAGGAAHLGGVVASLTTRPVIAVPLASTPLNGLDALLATVQMPAGVPVATMGIDKAGARNAGVLAAQILALADATLAERVAAYKNELARSVEERNARLQQRLAQAGS